MKPKEDHVNIHVQTSVNPVGYLPAAYPVNYSTKVCLGMGVGVRKRLGEEYLKSSV